MLDPEERAPVDQQIAQRAAAEGGKAGDDAYAHCIEALARRFQQPRERERDRGRGLDGGEDMRPRGGGRTVHESRTAGLYGDIVAEVMRIHSRSSMPARPG